MLNDWVKAKKPDDEELSKRLETARAELAKRQMAIKEAKLPVLVVLEGWGAAGKGSVLGRVIKNLDPRFFKTFPMSKATEEEKRRPFLYRYFAKIPEAGKFVFFDGSWMDEVTGLYLKGKIDKKEYAKKLESIKRFERQLHDNGYLVAKFFFHIGKEEQKKRIEALEENDNTQWRVSKWDKWQNKHYKECQKTFDAYLDATNQFVAPWYFIDSENRKWAELQMTELLVQNIDIALQNAGSVVPVLQNTFPLVKMPMLSEIPLDKTVSDEEYKAELDSLQKRLSQLHNELYHKKIQDFIDTVLI